MPSSSFPMQQPLPWLLSSLVIVPLATLLMHPQPELTDLDPPANAYMKKHFPSKRNTDDEALPLQGLTVAVTGATSGIGMEVTRKLASLGATVIAIGRSPTKLATLKRESAGRTIETVVADLTDLDSVSKASSDMLARFDKHGIDILINNAGIHTGFDLFRKPVTVQGYDLVFGVNYLSHFLLTELLMPLLRKSKHPKIVQISSAFHVAVSGTDLDAATNKKGEMPIAAQPGGSHGFLVYRSQRQYANSKLAQILHARSLSRKYQGIEVVSVCPTWVASQIAATSGSMAHSIFSKMAFPVDGYGLSSAFNAILDIRRAQPNDDFFINNGFQAGTASRDFGSLLGWTYNWIPFYDVTLQFASTVLIFIQRLRPVLTTAPSSGPSYNIELQDSLYEWSYKAVSPWLQK